MQLRAAIEAFPHHPNDEQGKAAWEAQKRAWHAQNPDGALRIDKPYPLQPDTAPVCTGETQRRYARESATGVG